MSSTIKVNNIQNLAGDDSGIDLSTNDQIILKTANTTALTIDSSQNATFASKLATSNLGTGAVLQVVNGKTNTTVSHTTTSFTDTGLSASITPTSTSNKILVLVNQNGFQKSASNTYSQLKLLRGSTDITIIMPLMGYNNSTNTEAYGSFSTCFLDSPATTSATTYKTQFNNGGGTGSVTLQTSTSGNAESTITLMEIAG